MKIIHLGVFSLGFAVFFLYGLDVVAQVIPATIPSAVPAPASGIGAWLQMNATLILALLLGASETLALIPSVNANSVFQLFLSVFKSLSTKK